MQKFLLLDISELCEKTDAAGKAIDQKAGIDLLADKIANGCTIQQFEYIPAYNRLLVLFDNNK